MPEASFSNIQYFICVMLIVSGAVLQYTKLKLHVRRVLIFSAVAGFLLLLTGVDVEWGSVLLFGSVMPLIFV